MDPHSRSIQYGWTSQALLLRSLTLKPTHIKVHSIGRDIQRNSWKLIKIGKKQAIERYKLHYTSCDLYRDFMTLKAEWNLYANLNKWDIRRYCTTTLCVWNIIQVVSHTPIFHWKYRTCGIRWINNKHTDKIYTLWHRDKNIYDFFHIKSRYKWLSVKSMYIWQGLIHINSLHL